VNQIERTPANPNFAADVTRVVMGLPAARLIGFEIARIVPGEADLQLMFREDLGIQGKFLDAIIGALADFAGGCAAATLLPPGATNMTADYTVKLLAPAQGEKLLACGSVLQPGSAITVAKTDIYIVREESRSLCATALVTMRNIPGKFDRQLS